MYLLNTLLVIDTLSRIINFIEEDYNLATLFAQ